MKAPSWPRHTHTLKKCLSKSSQDLMCKGISRECIASFFHFFRPWLHVCISSPLLSSTSHLIKTLWHFDCFRFQEKHIIMTLITIAAPDLFFPLWWIRNEYISWSHCFTSFNKIISIYPSIFTDLQYPFVISIKACNLIVITAFKWDQMKEWGQTPYHGYLVVCVMGKKKRPSYLHAD